MAERRRRVLKVEDKRGIIALSNAQVMAADVILDSSDRVIMDKKGIANRKATDEEIQEATVVA